MNNSQWRFLNSEMLTASIIAAFARARIYAPNTSDDDRSGVHGTLKEGLKSLAAQYESPVTEEQHLKNILHLATVVTDKHSRSLAGGEFRIGPAQKALNLYLKYLWCVDKVHEPPHCPIDARILALAAMRDVAWTQIASLDKYMECIVALRTEAEAKDQSLSLWELDQWIEAE